MVQIGYGTGTAWYKSGPGALDDKLVEATTTAIKMGYHHLDGAEMYNTEAELGKAIKASGVPREKLFVTTKCSKTTSNIEEHFNESLKKLGLDYVDLYLLHQPWDWEGNKKILQSAWAIMVSSYAMNTGVHDVDLE